MAKKLLITLGDAGGISAEIILKALNSIEIRDIVVTGNKDILYKTSAETGLSVPPGIEIIDIPFDMTRFKQGIPTAESGKHSFMCLKKACELAKNGTIRAIITAPVSKKSLDMAGFHYSGQTEILKEFFSSEPEMLFVAGELKVILLTRHIKLADVPQATTQEKIIECVLSLKHSLEKDFGISKPKIALCGLNPHAGENGLLGSEEENILIPAIKQLNEKHFIMAEGPFPADALWAKTGKAFLNNEKLPYSAYVACYHDQGLIPVKLLAMDSAVNVSINLPVIRASPCHGTAYDIAGQNKADCKSMIEAIKLADVISSRAIP